MRTTTLPTVLGLMAVGCLATACTKAQGTEAKPPRPVKAQEVTMAPAETAVRYSATIEAFQQVPLAFKASGYIDDLAERRGADGRLRVAQAGDRVTKGTVLARVREADYQEKVNQGRAKLAESEASLKKAQLDLERAKILFAAESLIKPDLDSARANYDSADARVTAAKVDIELALNALRDCQLISPATGILLERKVEVGSLVSAGSVGFLLGDLSAVKAHFGIPDVMIQSVSLGDSIAVTIEALGAATVSGRVSALAPAADPQSRVFDVEVTIPNQDGRLRPGMIGMVAIGGPQPGVSATEGLLTVPLTAIVKPDAADGKYAVLVVEPQGETTHARLRHVELGEVLGNAIAIRKGVALGDRVIVTGASLLVDGDPVRLIPDI